MYWNIICVFKYRNSMKQNFYLTLLLIFTFKNYLMQEKFILLINIINFYANIIFKKSSKISIFF